MRARLQPRYRLRADVLWLALLPGGIAAFCAYITLAGGHAPAPFEVEHTVWDGI